MTKVTQVIGLDCDASAEEGIKLLLRTRLEEMCDLRITALNWSDIEGVHDMRVASRRLRSALRDFNPRLKGRKFRRAVDAIKQTADLLGAVRDKDVAIAALEKLESNAPPDVGVGIELIATERRSQREIDRAALAEALVDDLTGLRAEFEASLESALGNPRSGKANVSIDKKELSFRALGRRIIESRMEELQDCSSSLYRPLTTKPLHRMRIAAKRFRYAIELFAPCWGTELDAFAKEVAAMQTSLGELHDCDVWIAGFGRYLQNLTDKKDGAELAATADLDYQRLQASVWLLGHFTKRRTSHYRNALDRWYKWDASDFFARLVTCMSSG